MRLKRMTAVLLSGILTFSAPSCVFAQELSDQIQDAVTEEKINSLLDDPDKAVDIIIYVKEFIDQQDITDSDIREVIDAAAEHFEVELSDSDKDTILKLARKFKDMDVDREKLKKDVEKIYGAMDFFGIDASDIKDIFDKAVDFFKDIFG